MLPFGESVGFRVLEVDSGVVLPVSVGVSGVVSAVDVLHSWSVPTLGLKVDANPGYCSFVRFSPLLCGRYYGQCSELCGANHSFIPIVLEVVPGHSFLG